MTKTPLNQLDVSLIIDTTGSMSALLDVARRHVARLIRETIGPAGMDLRVAVIEYRDHPTEAREFVTRVHPLTEKLPAVQGYLDGLRADEGGDIPEAVYDALVAACTLPWRANARRIAILVGDAPPHDPCGCGETAETIAARCEGAGLMLYALPLTTQARPAFQQLARRTGGESFETGVDQAMTHLQAVLSTEIANIAQEQQVFAAIQELPDQAWSLDAVSEAVGMNRHTVARLVSRLGARGFLAAATPVGG